MTAKKNSLTVSDLARYSLTDRERFTESLDVLAALKAAQTDFRNHIIRFHRDEYKLVTLDDLHRCGQWIFFKTYPEVGVRSFAGGFMCKHYLHCPPCAFRRAYVTALLSFRRISDLIVRKGLIPAFLSFSVPPGPDFAERFKTLKNGHRKAVRMRPARFPFIKGSAGSYEFLHQDGLWSLSVHELILVDPKSSPVPNPRFLTDQQLFSALLEFFSGSVLLLPPERRWEAIQSLQGTYPFLFEGCLASLAHPPCNESSDPPDALLADEEFFEEQHKWNKDRLRYEFSHVNSGPDMKFPFSFSTGSGRTGHATRSGRGRCARRVAERYAGSAAKEVQP